MKNFKELKIWQLGMEIVKETFEFCNKLPVNEKFGMISQMTRAAISIPANIAEGSSRNSERDYDRFLQYALGSAFELQTFIILSRNLGWGEKSGFQIENLLEIEIKMIYGLKKVIKNSLLCC